MTREETVKIMAVLKVAYPGFYRNTSADEAKAAVRLWSEMLEEEPYELVSAAVKTHIANDTKGFPPPIGELKETIRKRRNPYGLDPTVEYGVSVSGFMRSREIIMLRETYGEVPMLPEVQTE